jgi:flagellar basal-body rod protein FlgG
VYTGLYASASSLLNGQRTVDTITGNLANIHVPGYKEQRATYRPFPDVLQGALAAGQTSTGNVGQAGGGAYVQEILTSFDDGRLDHTGARDDFAVSGDGFFQILTDRGVRLTRNGSFLRDSEGVLRTSENDPVLGSRGLITIPDPEYTVKEDGEIFVTRDNGGLREEISIAKIEMVDVEDKSVLVREGNSRFRLPEGMEDSLVPADGKIQQGYLERSNLTVVDAMVQMIDAFRSYEMSQRMMRAIDETLDKVVNDVASTA